jgi:hypothetical protein
VKGNPLYIINVRGTSGSGKSTLMRKFMAQGKAEPVEFFGAKGTRALVTRVTGVNGLGSPTYVFGPYTSPCGGCDAITDYGNIVPELLRRYAPKGHILFEGLLISGGIGAVGRTMLELAGKSRTVKFALLDTPLELCVDRVNQRRAARGVLEPVNPRNTEQKYRAAWKTQDNVPPEHVATIDHTQPLKSLMSLFGVKLRKEPT